MRRLLASVDPRRSAEASGCTALHLACESGHEAIADLLLVDGRAMADAADGCLRTPAHRAAEQGHVGIVKLLAEKGLADLSAVDERGRSVSESAAARGLTDAAEKIDALKRGLPHAPLRRWYASEQQRITSNLTQHSILLGRPLESYGEDYGPVPPPQCDNDAHRSDWNKHAKLLQADLQDRQIAADDSFSTTNITS